MQFLIQSIPNFLVSTFGKEPNVILATGVSHVGAAAIPFTLPPFVSCISVGVGRCLIALFKLQLKRLQRCDCHRLPAHKKASAAIQCQSRYGVLRDLPLIHCSTHAILQFDKVAGYHGKSFTLDYLLGFA